MNHEMRAGQSSSPHSGHSPAPHPGPATASDGPSSGIPAGRALDLLALRATLHCLTGCAIGEVLGLVIGTALGWGNGQTLLLAILLAFTFGYALTMRPLLAAGIAAGRALRLALAADTISIGIMELVDNAIMLVIPGAMAAPLTSGLFWGSLLVAMLLAGLAAFPANRWLIRRGKGHAVVSGSHHGH